MKRTSLENKHILKYAEDEARSLGLRWSETRTQVLATLLDAKKPVTAYQLMDMVAHNYDRSIKPASIYRSLEALASIGIIAKIESLNSFVVCKHPEHKHQHVFLVCDNCGDIDEIADHGIDVKLSKGAAEKGFKAMHQILELHGNCNLCQG